MKQFQQKEDWDESPDDDSNNYDNEINTQYTTVLNSKCAFLQLNFCQFQIKTKVRFLV